MGLYSWTHGSHASATRITCRLGVLARNEAGRGGDSHQHPMLQRLFFCGLVPYHGRGFPSMIDVRERAGRGVQRVTAAGLVEMKPSAPATWTQSRRLPALLSTSCNPLSPDSWASRSSMQAIDRYSTLVPNDERREFFDRLLQCRSWHRPGPEPTPARGHSHRDLPRQATP